MAKAKRQAASPLTSTPPDSQALNLLVQRWETLRLRGKKAYSEAGQLLAQIAARMQAGETCVLQDGRQPRLIDKGTPEFWKGRSYTREESYLSRYDLSLD
jgi:hypothetical protein